VRNRRYKEFERAESAKPEAPRIDPATQTTLHPYLFVRALTIGPINRIKIFKKQFQINK
jgi:hypothetical protein